jgi:hypothetical protein
MIVNLPEKQIVFRTTEKKQYNTLPFLEQAEAIQYVKYTLASKP